MFTLNLTTNHKNLSVVVSHQQEDCLEKVINDTECLFKSREKEYQETIDQIEVRHLPYIFITCILYFLWYFILIFCMMLSDAYMTVFPMWN